MEDLVQDYESRKFIKAAEVLKTISSPYRLEIIKFLEDCKYKAVHEIQASLGIEPTLLSHHLIKMKDRGILVSFKKGRNVYYKLQMVELLKVMECINKLNF